MLRFQILVVSLLVGALILAGVGNKRLRDQLDRANRSIDGMNKTDTNLRVCRQILEDHKSAIKQLETEKQTMNTQISQMKKEIDQFRPTADRLPGKNKEVQDLKGKLNEASKREAELKKQVDDAQKALDAMKAQNAEKAKATGNKEVKKTD